MSIDSLAAQTIEGAGSRFHGSRAETGRTGEVGGPRGCALITGIHGFCGRHLALHLAQHGDSVWGMDVAAGRPLPGIRIESGDIRDRAFVLRVIEAVQPTHIYHLAALIAPSADLGLLYDVNVRGTDNLLEAVHASGLKPVTLIPGSSAAYGLVGPGELPIRESQPFRPLNAYVVVKIAQEMLAYTYYARHGLSIVRTRAFNLTGPGEPPSLVCSALARQVAEIEASQAGASDPQSSASQAAVLRVGNLTPQRDFVDVRDVVRAYRLLALQGQPGEVYNVCSGQAASIRTCLETMLGMAKAPIRVEQDPARMRPADLPISVGDGGLLYRKTGWRPEIPLEQSLSDLLGDWRDRIRLWPAKRGHWDGPTWPHQKG